MKKYFLLGLKTIFSLFLFLTLEQVALAATSTDSGNNPIESQSSIPQIMAAAEAGDPDAQYALGYIYYYGRGIPQDMKLAKQWIRKAANQGQQQAVQAEKILLGVTPSIQPKVNPIIQSNEGSPDQAGAPVQKLKTIRSEPVAQEHKIEAQEKKAAEPAAAPAPAPVPLSDEKPKAEPIVAKEPQPKPVQAKAKPVKVKKEKVSKVFSTAPTLKNVKGPYFTIQLISSSSKKDVIRFIQKSHLKQASYYQTYRDGRDWYVVTYGKYPSRKAATSAIRTLPASIRNNSPWVKSSQAVNNEMKKTRH